LANGRTLLFPIDWPEPFGLEMTEGVPVIAWRKESVPESSPIASAHHCRFAQGRRSAVHEGSTTNRGAVRTEFEASFTAAQMARNYAAAYHLLLARPRRHLMLHRARPGQARRQSIRSVSCGTVTLPNEGRNKLPTPVVRSTATA
jgi:hypothetical protein